MFKKVLVANRGEIALRVIRTLRELGIGSVAVFSEADAESLHVKFADEAVCVGPADPTRSYLNMPSIIAAAEITRAEAVHPGYGFLSENAQFAELCGQCGLTWLGPNPDIMRLLGDKVSARGHAKSVGLPVLEGSEAIIDEETFENALQEIGLPAMLKAAGGGGGRGMKVLRDREGALAVFSAAAREAGAAFAKSELFLERLLERPHHVEVQIVGTATGQVVSLGVRDCSAQRRHQKILEESPAAWLDAEVTAAIEADAVKLCSSLDYVGVGTVEFLVSGDEYFFIEVNPRLQVEHPVTEAVTGVDLVECQLHVAAGEYQNLEDVRVRGHAIEMRINAEDSVKFAPSCGVITGLNLPGGVGVRVDTHLYEGYEVTPHYDSLLAKLIVRAQTREGAIARANRALREFVVEGPQTNLDFFRRFLASETFRSGVVHTSTLSEFQEKTRR